MVPWSRRASDESLALLLLTAEALSERAERTGFVFYVAGNNDVVRYIPAVEQDDLDAPIIYQDAEGKEAWRLSRQSEVGTCREGKVLETCI